MNIETFLLYSQPIPSQNLGFIDPKASTLDVTVGERGYTIHQSPAVLSSSRAGGTTGAGESPSLIPIFGKAHNHNDFFYFECKILTISPQCYGR